MQKANHHPGQNTGTSSAGELKEEELTLDTNFGSEKLVLRCHMQIINVAFHGLPGSGDLPIQGKF